MKTLKDELTKLKIPPVKTAKSMHKADLHLKGMKKPKHKTKQPTAESGKNVRATLNK